MRCPSCGDIIEANFQFCGNCGASIPEPDDKAPVIAVVTPSRPEPSILAEESAAHPVVPTRVAQPAQAGPEQVHKLIVTGGLLAGRSFTIGPQGLLIGRDPANCQVVVADDEISRIHAWVGFDELGQVIVRDRKSANGTYVNQVRVQERVLRPTDVFAVGLDQHHTFRVELAAVPAEAPAPQQASIPSRGETQVLRRQSTAEVAAVRVGDKAAGGTVAIKLTDLSARPHVELIVDKYAVKTIEISDKGLTVGRDVARCQIVMEHPSVSALHAEISSKPGNVTITDRSTNGTFVNGKRVQTHELADGDYITFGRYAGKSLIFRTGLEPKLKVETVDLSKDRIRIGRDPSNDFAIDHPVVSKNHAEIVKQGGKYFVVDLGSTNGTFVNGIKIKRHELQELDRIVIGPSELHFSGASFSHAPDAHVVRLDIQNLNFQVTDRTSGKPKLLLDDISLVVKPRELIGLLGPSGAGKSTLMNALNGFTRPTAGAVLYNNADLYQNLDSLKSTIGFVPQEDIMHKQLSVRRCLYYAAKLRLPEDLSEEEINRRVDEMLDILKVDPQRWDNPVSTLSGGQRKRISIGIELLPKPGVLFLDEPTAGLDPRTETLMMMLFRQLANQGSTIIITTHLLASFGVLDRVVVLVQGRLAFYGPGNKFLEYFKAPVPADVYDDLTDNNTVPYSLELKKRFAESALYKEQISDPMKVAAPAPKAAGAAAKKGPSEKGSMIHQYGVLLRRNWELKFGDRGQTALLFLQAPLIALLVSLMAGAPNQIQTIFMAMFAALWFGCSNAVREIVDEQTIYKRERQTGLKIPSYIFSKLFVLAVIALAQCASVIAILLFVRRALVLSPTEILGAIVIMFLVAVNGTLIGLVISSLVNTPEKALTLFPLVLIPELLLSGLFLPVRPIQTILPITTKQLFEGQLFAQPEAKAKAAEELKKQASTEEETAAQTGAGAHQVTGAITPSAEVQKKMQYYTPAPVEGMPTFVRMLSMLAVSRWGMEALSDICIHGQHSIQDYAYKIINTVYISMHPDDVEKLKAGLEAPAEAFAAAGSFPLPSNFWKDKAPYVGILTVHMLVATLAVLLLMKRKDVV
ncbi:MAG: FHA domain-containing protein [Acidobacteria bacterium]|nr:FHA domain-containing protein [Acidobacteriota bacterium]